MFEPKASFARFPPVVSTAREPEGPPHLKPPGPPHAPRAVQANEAARTQCTNEKTASKGGLFSWTGGVTDGTRTHDNQNHNLGLYQLSYGHH